MGRSFVSSEKGGVTMREGSGPSDDDGPCEEGLDDGNVGVMGSVLTCMDLGISVILHFLS